MYHVFISIHHSITLKQYKIQPLLGQCWATVSAWPMNPGKCVNPISQINTIHSLSGISLWRARRATSLSVFWNNNNHKDDQLGEQTNTRLAHSWRGNYCLLPFESPWKQPNTQQARSSDSTQHTAGHVWWRAILMLSFLMYKNRVIDKYIEEISVDILFS